MCLNPGNRSHLHPEQKERYRRSVLKMEIVAVRENMAALESLARLAECGCDIGALWHVLGMYRHPIVSQELQTQRDLANLFRQRSAPILRQLASLGRKVRSAQQSKPNTAYDFMFERLATDVDAWIRLFEDAEEKLSIFSNARGPMRSEMFLVQASIYLRTFTGRPCYKEIADILEALDVAREDNEDVDAETIRRICERYTPTLGARDLTESAKSFFESFRDDEVAIVLREALMSAIAQERHRTPNTLKHSN